LIIQASPPFTQALLEEVERCTANKSLLRLRCAISGHVSHSDQDTLRLVQELEPRADALAVHCKDTPANFEMLRRIGQNGKPVATFSMDLDPVARAGYVGLDNRSGRFISPMRSMPKPSGSSGSIKLITY
jgi:ABC-type sugar transport system substrate-binding protein